MTADFDWRIEETAQFFRDHWLEIEKLSSDVRVIPMTDEETEANVSSLNAGFYSALADRTSAHTEELKS